MTDMVSINIDGRQVPLRKIGAGLWTAILDCRWIFRRDFTHTGAAGSRTRRKVWIGIKNGELFRSGKTVGVLFGDPLVEGYTLDDAVKLAATTES